MDEALTLALNQEPMVTVRKIGKLIHIARAQREYISSYIYNLVFNVCRADEERPLVFY